MDPQRYRNLKFQSLREEDIPILYSWLQKPRVREFYHKKSVPAWNEVRAEYLQRLDPDWPTKCLLSYAGSDTIGYVQAYRVADYPEYAAKIQEGNGISLDLLIGDAEFVGKGWGRVILLKFINEVAFPVCEEEHICWIYHERLNHRALAASGAAGFKHVRYFTEDGDPKELLAVSRNEASTLAARVSRG